MGLASKLAASQSQNLPAGPPSASGYAPYPGGSGPPGQQAQGYYPSSGSTQPALFKSMLQAAVQERKLTGFYPPNSPVLDQIANRAPAQIDRLCSQWRIPREIANDVVKLALYDVILFIDDSGSMQFEESGERIKDLRLIMERVVFATILFDDDGISMRFMNAQNHLEADQNLINNIKSEQQVEHIMSRVRFSGLTPMGTNLRSKVVEDIISRARQGQLRKPVLVITITDGQPAGEPVGALTETIKYAVQQMAAMPQYGQGSIAFQFAQVGNDQRARSFLAQLDNDPMVGHLVDCTSNYENESAEMAQAVPPVELTPELWLVKLLLGSIDPSYDSRDEKAAGRRNGPPAPPQLQNSYAPGPQMYGAPPPMSPHGGYPPGPPPGQYPPVSPHYQYQQGQFPMSPHGQYPPPQQFPPQPQVYNRAPGPPYQGQQYPGQPGPGFTPLPGQPGYGGRR